MTEEASIFKVLSDDTRLRVLNVLLATEASLCVCEITDALQVPQYQVSKHLFLLRSMGLVSAERKGTWVYYSLPLDRERGKRLFAFLRGFLNDGLFAADRACIIQRLGRREGGKCVTSFAPVKRLGKPVLVKTK
jgi:ArsR family transcriptional regulator